jgi:hypothetical protein
VAPLKASKVLPAPQEAKDHPAPPTFNVLLEVAGLVTVLVPVVVTELGLGLPPPPTSSLYPGAMELSLLLLHVVIIIPAETTAVKYKMFNFLIRFFLAINLSKILSISQDIFYKW